MPRIFMDRIAEGIIHSVLRPEISSEKSTSTYDILIPAIKADFQSSSLRVEFEGVVEGDINPLKWDMQMIEIYIPAYSIPSVYR